MKAFRSKAVVSNSGHARVRTRLFLDSIENVVFDDIKLKETSLLINSICLCTSTVSGSIYVLWKLDASFNNRATSSLSILKHTLPDDENQVPSDENLRVGDESGYYYCHVIHRTYGFRERERRREFALGFFCSALKCLSCHGRDWKGMEGALIQLNFSFVWEQFSMHHGEDEESRIRP